VVKRRDRIFSENAALLYNHAVRYYQTLGQSLADQFAARFPKNDFPDRKRLGINELKPDNQPVHEGPFSERRGPFE
jgi:hypothetical protein